MVNELFGPNELIFITTHVQICMWHNTKIYGQSIQQSRKYQKWNSHLTFHSFLSILHGYCEVFNDLITNEFSYWAPTPFIVHKTLWALTRNLFKTPTQCPCPMATLHHFCHYLFKLCTVWIHSWLFSEYIMIVHMCFKRDLLSLDFKNINIPILNIRNWGWGKHC